MTENRLEFIDAEQSEMLKQSTISELRNAAKTACQFALERTNFSHPILEEGLEALEKSQCGDVSLQNKLQSLVDRLDEIQWDLQEKMAEGSIELSDYLAAFHTARAVNSLYFALNADPFVAASEAIYEAHAATDELVTLKQKILQVLQVPTVI
ncbi:MAG: hypothetical protein JGK30_12435 [Microcoleus sp. PH2017_40_RAT_O_B]|uniref:hypothetical protein n=1 Tax=unclassified Microcoleus TaxID=2642155 RepID=UPI001D3440B2|nr:MULTISPECIES: hypothetical protein [unclassified Microcoleus]MCC3572677.1 hypothetical protein [Microcoleus sp. PH2017_34_RAT_O_A]MCC3610284.1 hypothetical protein [Microcoleus sp. PH2017_40_RAT_O_B]